MNFVAKKETTKDKDCLTVRWKKIRDNDLSNFNTFYVSVKSSDKSLNVLFYADEKNLNDGIYEVKYYSNSEIVNILEVTVTPFTSLGSAIASTRSFNFSKRKKIL